MCCLEHRIKKMQEDHAKEIHMLQCQNHKEHENEKNWAKARDANHDKYVKELAEKHESELQHFHAS